MTLYKVTNARTGRFVRFACISDVLSYLRASGRTITNVRLMMRTLTAGKAYSVGPHIVERLKK